MATKGDSLRASIAKAKVRLSGGRAAPDTRQEVSEAQALRKPAASPATRIRSAFEDAAKGSGKAVAARTPKARPAAAVASTATAKKRRKNTLSHLTEGVGGAYKNR